MLGGEAGERQMSRAHLLLAVFLGWFADRAALGMSDMEHVNAFLFFLNCEDYPMRLEQ